jgi:hypothetical protein
LHEIGSGCYGRGGSCDKSDGMTSACTLVSLTVDIDNLAVAQNKNLVIAEDNTAHTMRFTDSEHRV